MGVPVRLGSPSQRAASSSSSLEQVLGAEGGATVDGAAGLLECSRLEAAGAQFQPRWIWGDDSIRSPCCH